MIIGVMRPAVASSISENSFSVSTMLLYKIRVPSITKKKVLNCCIPFSWGCITAHRAVVFELWRVAVSGAHCAAVVGAGGLMGAVEHVHHRHAKVHPQRVGHEEGIAGKQRQAVTGGTAHWGCRMTK